MIYGITHKTTYQYQQAVSLGMHIAYLAPRAKLHQVCISHELTIVPRPATVYEQVDFFGNRFTFFAVQEVHHELRIESRSRVDSQRASSEWPDRSPAWDHVARSLTVDRAHDVLDAYQFCFESPRIPPGPEFAHYAAQSFPPGRPLTEGTLDLTERIHKNFVFDSKATNVRTSPLEVLRLRRGVCQDFAHLQIACLRSIGLAARYVSGYIRTYPPPGRPRLIGADASHAWVSVYCPDSGWLDVDPTNNLIPSDGHVTLAWGRDFGDVSPVRGVILGGRDHKLEVGVDMEPIAESEAAADTPGP